MKLYRNKSYSLSAFKRLKGRQGEIKVIYFFFFLFLFLFEYISPNIELNLQNMSRI